MRAHRALCKHPRPPLPSEQAFPLGVCPGAQQDPQHSPRSPGATGAGGDRRLPRGRCRCPPRGVTAGLAAAADRGCGRVRCGLAAPREPAQRLSPPPRTTCKSRGRGHAPAQLPGRGTPGVSAAGSTAGAPHPPRGGASRSDERSREEPPVPAGGWHEKPAWMDTARCGAQAPPLAAQLKESSQE